jgi:hypothetical protein
VTDDAKSPVEAAVEQAVGLGRDLFVYAPIGLLLEGPALLPTLIERGRNQVATARVLGQFAVQQGQTELTKHVAKLSEQGGGLGGLLDLLAPGGARRAAAPSRAAPASAVAPEPEPARAAAAATTATAGPAASAPPRSSPEAAALLAIPDYDSLSASQVVNRLEGLSGDELEAVREYEGGHRGRKTILNKIAQLQG